MVFRCACVGIEKGEEFDLVQVVRTGDGFSIESNDAIHCVAVMIFLADLRAFE